MNDALPFEMFRPHLREGHITPEEGKIIVETTEPFNQIVLPAEMLDVLILCTGKFTLREIIERVYQKRGFLHFKTVFHSIYKLRDRNFFKNGDELEVDNSASWLPNLPSLNLPNLIRIPLFKRVRREHSFPRSFYFLSMLTIVGSILGLGELDYAGNWFRIDDFGGSFALSLASFFGCLSVLLTLRNVLKVISLLLATGRVYNIHLVINPLAVFVSVGDESLFLIRNKLFATVYHLSLIFSYFGFAALGTKLLPDLSHWFVTAIILGLLDLDPFRQSEVSKYVRGLWNDENRQKISSFFSRNSFLSLLESTPSGEGQRFKKIFPVLCALWSLSALLVLGRIADANFSDWTSRLKASGWVEPTLAGLALLWVVGSFLIVSASTLQLFLLHFILPVFRQIQTLKSLKSRFRTPHFSDAELTARLKEIGLFSYFSDGALKGIIDQAESQVLERGSYLFAENHFSQSVFALLSGEVAISKPSASLSRFEKRVLAPTALGEIAILDHWAQGYDAKAASRCLVLKIPVKAIQRAVVDSQYMGEIENFKRLILVQHFFATAPMFRDLPDELVHLFITKSQMQTVDSGQIVFKQGSPGDGFYMVIRGSMKVEINGHVVKKIKQGGFFGEISVIADVPRTATVIADESSLLLKLDADNFWSILCSHIEMAIFIESIGEMRMREDLEYLVKDAASF